MKVGASLVLGLSFFASPAALAQESASPKSLEWDTPVDPDLQKQLERIDKELGEKLGIPAADRGCGIYDLETGRLALVNGDKMFDGASVPDIVMPIAYFEMYPEAAGKLDWPIEQRLQRLIKGSDKEMSRDWPMIVGLERIRETLESPKYKLYDREHGGGIWLGAFEGMEGEPQKDPIGNLARAVTMRQCLRFFDMLHRESLSNSAVSRSVKDIFRAPLLEFENQGFVHGLHGRNVGVLRKSGFDGDWHVDVAIVQGVQNAYAIAGVVRHPKGEEYLSGLAGEVDTLIHGKPALPRPWHDVNVYAGFFGCWGEGLFAGNQYEDIPPKGVFLRPGQEDETEAVFYRTPNPLCRDALIFNEALLSWNAVVPPGAGMVAEIRVGKSFENFWSPFLHVGDWGEFPSEKKSPAHFELGKIDADYFRSDHRFDSVQWRIRASYPNPPRNDSELVCLTQVTLTLSDTTGLPTSYGYPRSLDFMEEGLEGYLRKEIRLPVPFRSQRAAQAALAPRICSPTSVAMAMEYQGASVPTEEVAARLFDPVHDIYGNWTRAIQGANSFGVPGYLARFSDWGWVKSRLSHGDPIVISIKAKPGELPGAPYPSTNGHLLVLTGYSANDEFFVNDPAAETPEQGQRLYKRAELEQVWMRNASGTAYVFGPGPGRLVDIDSHMVVKLPYASEANFTGKQLYSVKRAVLRNAVSERLERVRHRLYREKGLSLEILDAYRPLSVQKKMWEILPDERYVANPAKGSRHNRGAAVDVTLVDKNGSELEMPSAFDHFGPESHRDYAGGSEQARKNRKVLQDAMEAEGFVGLPSEWWHFDDPDWEKYPILDIPLEELP